MPTVDIVTRRDDIPKHRGAATVRPGLIPRQPLAMVLLLAMLLSPVLTVLNNGDTITIGQTVLPGLRAYDSLSGAVGGLMAVIPMLLGRKLLARPEDARRLLSVLVVAGSAYTLLALYEIRMSPQMNNMVYGFFPHSWIQHVRNGGYRPLVFLSHGLWLAIFFSACIVAAAGLWRLGGARRGLFLLATLWLLGTLILSKSLGALVITLALLALMLLTGQRLKLLAGIVVAGLMLGYPALRANDMIPVERVMTLAGSLNPERAASLQVRLDNEDKMLAKAMERPLFGWGGWSRSRVLNEDGLDHGIADGYWVITIGVKGWFGYLAEVGLLTLPLLLLALSSRRGPIPPEAMVLALILMGNLIDMIPNATLTPITWLVVGALWGQLETIRSRSTAGTDAAAAVVAGRPPAMPGAIPAAGGYARPAPATLPAGQMAQAAAPPSTPPAARQAYTRQTERRHRVDRRPQE